MTVKLAGYQSLEFNENQGTQVRELIEQVLFYYEIPNSYARAFAVQRGNQVYEYDEVLHHKHHNEELIELFPKYICQIEPDMPLTLVYCIVSYCFTNFKQNVYNYTENLNLQIILCMRKILEESDLQIQAFMQQKRQDLSMQTPYSQSTSLSLRPSVQNRYQQFGYSESTDSKLYDSNYSVSTQLTDVTTYVTHKTINTKKLFPEKFIAAYDRVQKHINLMEMLFYDEFNQLCLKEKLYYVHKLFQQSSYFGLYIYPCLDVQLDWVSYAGISFDGICLLDAELSLGYAFFPYFIIKSITSDENHQVFIEIDYQLSVSRQQLANQGLSSPDEIDISFRNLKQLGKKNQKQIILPTVVKIPASRNQDTDNLAKTIFYKQLSNTQNKIKDEASIANVLMVGISDTLKQRKQRENIILKFLNKNQQNNFMQTYKRYSQQQQISKTQNITISSLQNKQNDFQNIQVPHPKIVRNLRVQSRSIAELFCNGYLNYCQSFCVIPDQKILDYCITIIDLQYFRNKTLLFQELELSNVELSYADINALGYALKFAFNYSSDKTFITLKAAAENSIQEYHYTNGVGTPYSPFIEHNNYIIQNLQIKKLKLSNNNFHEKREIIEIAGILNISQINECLEFFTFSYNKLNYEEALILSNGIQNLRNLKELDLSFTSMNSIALCNIFYLLDHQQIFVQSFKIAGIKLKTKAHIQQIALYIEHAYSHSQSPMLLVDLSGCFSNQQKARQFTQVFETTTKQTFQHIFNRLGNGNKQNYQQSHLLQSNQCTKQQNVIIDTLVVKYIDFLTVQELLNICRIIEL